MRGKNLIQLIKVLDLLSKPQGVTRKEIIDYLGMSDRSVSRLFNTVEDLGFPIVDLKDPLEKEKRYGLEPSFVMKLPNITLPDLTLSVSEVIALSMLRGECVIFNGTEIERQITSAFAKLLQFVPDRTRRELKTLTRIFMSKSVHSKDYQGKEDTISTLTESILNQNACEITYHVFYKDEIKTETIGPLHFYENNGGLYLFAVKLSENKVRSYAVERIKRIKKLNRDVDYPPGFDPEDQLNSAFDMIHGDPVSVKIRFSKHEARYIKEKQWAKHQHIKDHPDGSVTLTMTTSGYRDVKRWVMSFGKEARLLEPEVMIREIEGELREILKGS